MIKWILASLGILFAGLMVYLIGQLWTLDLEDDELISKNSKTELIDNKSIPVELKEEIVEALSHFPELKNVKIEFRFKDQIEGSFMQAQPKVASLFNTQKLRSYVINIKKHFQSEDTIVHMASLPKSVLVGWIGHELGHILDYHKKDFFSITELGIGYLLSEDYIKATELRADIHAIQHGLSDKITATKEFILNHPKLSEQYKSKIRRLYLSSEGVEEITRK
ncbi:MAG: hypothetical protein AAF363_16490 [Bacteroidota bacterium]